MRRAVWLLSLVALLGCNNNNNNSVSFAFNRPERLDFACFAQFLTTGSNAALHGTWTTLPLACCRGYDPSNYRIQGIDLPAGQTDPDAPGAQPQCFTQRDSSQQEQPLGSATLHALVTQSTRGEVAAVDLVANKVLDSDRQIPGFTFLDSGGLPTAVVVPPTQPKGDGTQGPTWLYVASAEQSAVRAIPMCRFRNGASCGPDTAAQNADATSYLARLRVPLPGPPADMILGPDDALWVTLPERGELWRIALPEAGVIDDAFAIDPATRLPQLAQRYAVPAMPDSVMAEPIAERDEYVTACGLGAAYAPTSFTLPTAPRGEVQAAAEPARFKYDAESGLLFVSDRASPGVHVFRPGTDGSLTALGALHTGQPLREFVLTPKVPSTAITGQALIARTTPAEDAAAETKRYLYGIDARGAVAVFAFEEDAEGDLPTLTPLLAPTPDLLTMRYADRLALPTPSQALEVIDTRSLSTYTCGQESLDDLTARRNAIRALPKPLSAELTRELARVEARISIYDTAANEYLRGVFVSVVSTAGVISLIDVHDLDVSCRAQKFCCASDSGGAGANGVPASCIDGQDATGAKLIPPRSTDAHESMAVRRHTLHLNAAGPQTVEVASSSLLAAQTCDASQAHAAVPQLGGQVCTPADVYQEQSEVWRVEYQGVLPSSAMEYAHWETVPGNDQQLALVPPRDFHLCALGVEVGDLVAIRGRAPEGLRTRCPDPSSETAPLFVIRDARDDRLTVEPYLRSSADQAPEVLAQRAREQTANALACYPDFVGAELRAGGFLVTGQSGRYLHRVIAGLDGSCIADTTQDPLINSRVRTGLINGSTTADVFQNPFVSFALAPADPSALPETRETSVSVSRASVLQQLNTVNAGDQVAEALPSSLRYLPEQGSLFLLDTAGQGLRRYRLRPFERETTVFR